MGLTPVTGGWVYNVVGTKQLYWISTKRRCSLSARVKVISAEGDKSFTTGLTEEDMDQIHQWCQSHNCGVRTSFDTFKFKTKKEMTMFLMRWG